MPDESYDTMFAPLHFMALGGIGKRSLDGQRRDVKIEIKRQSIREADGGEEGCESNRMEAI